MEKTNNELSANVGNLVQRVLLWDFREYGAVPKFDRSKFTLVDMEFETAALAKIKVCMD